MWASLAKAGRIIGNRRLMRTESHARIQTPLNSPGSVRTALADQTTVGSTTSMPLVYVRKLMVLLFTTNAAGVTNTHNTNRPVCRCWLKRYWMRSSTPAGTTTETLYTGHHLVQMGHQFDDRREVTDRQQEMTRVVRARQCHHADRSYVAWMSLNETSILSWWISLTLSRMSYRIKFCFDVVIIICLKDNPV